MKTILQPYWFVNHNPVKEEISFSQEKYLRKIRRASLLGQLLILLISLFAAYSLFANPASLAGKKKKVPEGVINISPIQKFSALLMEDEVGISWVATKTSGYCIYIVQKTRDGAQYTTAGSMRGQPSSKKLRYQVIDTKPWKGIYYYRIKKIYEDNSIEFSSLIRFWSPVEKGDDLTDALAGGTITEVTE